jgi:ribulose-5-phosphate 4-epimerase/fuculose-1-phosphate aldolase
MSRNADAAEVLAELLSEYRYVIGNESDFQEGVSRVLERNHWLFYREHDLGRTFGRIDFFLPDAKVGIELKVQGSPTAVLRQLHRYALSPKIHALILVTGRSRLAGVPQTLNGKPVLAVAIWSGQF